MSISRVIGISVGPLASRRGSAASSSGVVRMACANVGPFRSCAFGVEFQGCFA
jgi:hypothetical protein